MKLDFYDDYTRYCREGGVQPLTPGELEQLLVALLSDERSYQTTETLH